MARSIDTGTETLTAEVDDHGVAVITMNRPERRNAMTDGMLSGLALALADVETASDVRCVVLTGAGGAFCAGGDVKGFAEGGGAGATAGTSWGRRCPSAAAEPSSYRRRAVFDAQAHTGRNWWGRCGRWAYRLRLPVTCAIALDTAVMTTAFARVGLAGDYGGTWFLTPTGWPGQGERALLPA